MAIDVLFYVENGMTDMELTFSGMFVPLTLKEKIQGVSNDSRFFYSLPADYSGRLKDEKYSFTRDAANDLAFWKNIFEETSAAHIAVIKADAAFFDPEVFTEMGEVHVRYLAEFTFSENLPEGFTCEIYSSELVKHLPDTDEKTLTLDKVIKSNINQFDVELFYKEPDIRDKRISFRLTSPRERKIMENIFALNKKFPLYRDVRGLIESNPGTIFTSPAYVELEITGECSLDCIFCYRKSLKHNRGHMDKSLFMKLLESMRGFGLPYTLCFGGSGEPSDHPGFYAFMDAAVAEPLVELLVIETNGTKAGLNFKGYLEKPENSKIKVIVNNNALDNKSYARLHGGTDYNSVFNNIISLSELNNNGERVYVQVMKIKETDEFENEGDTKTYLDRFYDFWEGNRVPIILQKQDTYLGRIEDRTYSDLSPIRRVPCWHLQRDMYVLSDGTVSFCKQDVDGENAYGNITVTELGTILGKQRDAFHADYRGKLCTSPDCAACDEWYTFNF